jgi:hypothetical protein
MSLEYYDSHLGDPGMRYGHSSIPTVLILPSGEHTIDSYDELIGRLAKPKCRVIALSFPGTGKSKLIDTDSFYEGSISQKVVIAHDFLKTILFNRKKYNITKIQSPCHMNYLNSFFLKLVKSSDRFQ